MTRTSVEELAPEFDEQATVEAAQRGNQVALARLYEHYFPRVYRYASVRLANSEDAEDVTEEIFLRVIDNIDGFSFRGFPFGAWVFRIARNEVVSHVRRQKVRAASAPLAGLFPALNAESRIVAMSVCEPRSCIGRLSS